MISSMIDPSQATTRNSRQRPIQFKNDSSRKTEIFWVDPTSGDMVLQTPEAMLSGETLMLNSYVNHTFFIREVPDKSGTCNAGTTYSAPSLSPCKTAFIRVNDHHDGKQFHRTLNTLYSSTALSKISFHSVFHILEDMEVQHHVDSAVKDITDAIAANCQDKVFQQIQANKSMSPNDAIDAYVACAKPLVAHRIEETNKEISEQEGLRSEMAGEWEEYTCADFDLPTTTPTRKQNWNYEGKDHEVGVLLDRDRAKVHYVKVSLSSRRKITLDLICIYQSIHLSHFIVTASILVVSYSELHHSRRMRCHRSSRCTNLAQGNRC